MLKHLKKLWDGWPRGLRWLIVGVVAVVLGLAIAWLLFVPAADWLAHHDVGSVKGPLLQTARDAARGRLLTLGAGLFAVGALIYTARNYSLSREGQVTDRYTKAVEQLGSTEHHVRIGGIYALERIARDSAKDHPTVMEVLTAYVREHSLKPWTIPGTSRFGTRPDVQAAVTVIGRRNYKQDRLRLDLAGAILPRANLEMANLAAANLRGAILEGANLSFANLDATTVSTTFPASHVTALVPEKADLTDADLTDAKLSFAHLTGAQLLNTTVKGANFTSATLAEAMLIAANHLAEANLDDVELSPHDPVPTGWQRDPRTGRLKAIKTRPGTSASS